MPSGHRSVFYRNAAAHLPAHLTSSQEEALEMASDMTASYSTWPLKYVCRFEVSIQKLVCVAWERDRRTGNIQPHPNPNNGRLLLGVCSLYLSEEKVKGELLHL
jgi:hypothetical protein